MKISIIGTGYVGLVTGACLAECGHDVTCVDVDPGKVEMINSARSPIHEKGLSELMERHVGRRLRASTDLAAAVAATDVTFIAVGTPAADGKIDLSYVEAAASEIGGALRHKAGYSTVIVKSTVIPGTTVGVVRAALERASGKIAGQGFGLGMNPEFLTEGTAVSDFSYPDRLVLGGIDARTHDVLRELYSGFDKAVPRIVTSPTTAEMIKYASNAVLATMISFSNEIARLCRAVGNVDAADVMRGVHQAGYFTTRIGAERVTAPIVSFLEPGCGFGGSCLPKDVTALIGQGREKGLTLNLLRSVLDVNKGQIDEIMRLIRRHFASLQGVTVTILGIAFKPDTDDVRESPAFPIIRKLKIEGARVTAYDPVARPNGHEDLTDVDLAESLREAVANAQVVILVTRWKEFSQLAGLLKELGRRPLVVDGRRVLDPEAFAHYEGIGR
ncbi:UDP-glucose/GDP-mannose dehydrogenase family protein [Bradyrhizobium sp. SSUT112]|uniref:UDP-glucose dehydrogenase family protein n=1 Tax=Bradyrhizobium sp. SSUT112 TaxID=3040604 RepID=UPI00244A3E25|nr:UDP-glucose/GDP-mannose dehydrogenase family protein [Bradyrhizobium sp. SSUT112]MDH2355958.1 UDP-glucose/GDP-mannose dehydrogenase family protein [Bradyrhizobium sp. SSUT112]